jgi:hypothetical protein
MAGETTTTLANYIFTDYQDEVRETYYDALDFINFIGRVPPPKTGDSMDWIVKSAGVTAVNYTEGATPPAAQNQTNTTLTLAYKYAWDVAQVTGHAIDALRGGFLDPVNEALDDATRAVLYKQEQNMVASFIAAVNDDTNYGGATRATYNLDSVVVAGGSGALTAAMMSSLYEGVKLRKKKNETNDLFIASAYEQKTAYTEIAGVQYNEQNFNWDAMASRWDIGKMRPDIAYNGVPWFDFGSMTNTYVFMGRKSDFVIEEKRQISYKMLGAIDDSDRVLVTSAMELRCKDPYRCGRIEALTT